MTQGTFCASKRQPDYVTSADRIHDPSIVPYLLTVPVTAQLLHYWHVWLIYTHIRIYHSYYYHATHTPIPLTRSTRTYVPACVSDASISYAIFTIFTHNTRVRT